MLNIEGDPQTFKEAMASRDFAFWKEAADDEWNQYYLIILGS